MVTGNRMNIVEFDEYGILFGVVSTMLMASFHITYTYTFIH